jgi:serine/threonine protein kinase
MAFRRVKPKQNYNKPVSKIWKVDPIRNAVQLKKAIEDYDILVLCFCERQSLSSVSQTFKDVDLHLKHVSKTIRVHYAYVFCNADLLSKHPERKQLIEAEQAVVPSVKVFFRRTGETKVLADVHRESLSDKLYLTLSDAALRLKGDVVPSLKKYEAKRPKAWMRISPSPDEQDIIIPTKDAWMMSMLLRGQFVLDKKPLGEGGFGIVYSSKYLGLDVAVKVPREPFHTRDDYAAYIRELSCMHQLQHPNIQGLLGICLIADPEKQSSSSKVETVHQWCLVQPKRKRDLFEGMEDPNVTLSTKWKWVKQIASALAFMHSRNFVHFDIKPENILLDEYDNALISDLGTSRVHSPVVGVYTFGKTSLYTAPEAALFQTENPAGDPTPSAKADVYSFGVLVCELFAKTTFLSDELERQMKQNGLQHNKNDTPFQKEMRVRGWIKQRKVLVLQPGEGYTKDIPEFLVGPIRPCLAFDPVDRPSMVKVIKSIEFADSLRYPEEEVKLEQQQQDEADEAERRQLEEEEAEEKAENDAIYLKHVAEDEEEEERRYNSDSFDVYDGSM